MSHAELIKQVEDFWDRSSCGERLATGPTEREKYEAQGRARFELEPIPELAKFAEGAGKDVLEIGVGMGADHLEWAKSAPRSLTGIDLTERAIEHTKRRFEAHGLASNLSRGNAEALPFDDESFDLVYSFGVLHHTPDTPRAVREVFRVLRPGGIARIMIYHTYSLTGYMLGHGTRCCGGGRGRAWPTSIIATWRAPGRRPIPSARRGRCSPTSPRSTRGSSSAGGTCSRARSGSGIAARC